MRLTACLLFLVLLYSCDKEEKLSSTLNNDRAYFPLERGHWVEYEVDSIIHNDIDDRFLVDTSIDYYHFYIREVIDSSFTDGEGDTAWSVSRFRRDADSLPWRFMALWTAKLNMNSAERVEENQRYVKLHFPFNDKAEWNGNAYNSYQEELYTYDDLFDDKTVNGYSFDSTVTVVQNDFVSSINRIYKIEQYASGVGVIYKQTDSVRTANTPTGMIILNGYEYKVRVTDYKR